MVVSEFMVNKSLAYMYCGAQMLPRLLTETQVKRLLAPYKDQLYGLGDCLFLRHRPGGKKTFILRRKVAGEMSKYPLAKQGMLAKRK